jgi:hypothetical protein
MTRVQRGTELRLRRLRIDEEMMNTKRCRPLDSSVNRFSRSRGLESGGRERKASDKVTKHNRQTEIDWQLSISERLGGLDCSHAVILSNGARTIQQQQPQSDLKPAFAPQLPRHAATAQNS